MKFNRCDHCHRILEHGAKVTVIISDVEVENRYSKRGRARLRLNTDAIDLRMAKVYCNNCISLSSYFIEKKEGNHNEDNKK